MQSWRMDGWHAWVVSESTTYYTTGMLSNPPLVQDIPYLVPVAVFSSVLLCTALYCTYVLSCIGRSISTSYIVLLLYCAVFTAAHKFSHFIQSNLHAVFMLAYPGHSDLKDFTKSKN
jgi:hypothetical protein